MPKLNLNVAAKRLQEADEMRAVKVAKVPQPDKSPGTVNVKAPSTNLRLTRVNSTNKITMQGQKEDSKSGLEIPTAEFGGMLS